MGNKASQPQAATPLPANEVAFEVVPKKSWRGLELARSRDAKKVPRPLRGHVYEYEYRAKMSAFLERIQTWQGARREGRSREAMPLAGFFGTGAVCLGLYWDTDLSDPFSLMCFAVIPILVLICVVVEAVVEWMVAKEAFKLKSDTKDIFKEWEPSIQTTLKEVRAAKGGPIDLKHMTHFNLCFVVAPISTGASVEEGEARRVPAVATTSSSATVSCNASAVTRASTTSTSSEQSATTNEIQIAVQS